MSRIQTPTVAVNPNVELASREAPTIVYQPEPYVPETYFDYEQLSNVLGAGVQAAKTFLEVSLIDRKMQAEVAADAAKERSDRFRVGLSEATLRDKQAQVGEKLESKYVRDFLGGVDYDSLAPDDQELYNKTLGDRTEEELEQQRKFNSDIFIGRVRSKIEQVKGLAMKGDPDAISTFSSITNEDQAVAFINGLIDPQEMAVMRSISSYDEKIYRSKFSTQIADVMGEAGKYRADLRKKEVELKTDAMVQWTAKGMSEPFLNPKKNMQDETVRNQTVQDFASNLQNIRSAARGLDRTRGDVDLDKIQDDAVMLTAEDIISRGDANQLFAFRNMFKQGTGIINDQAKRNALMEKLDAEVKKKFEGELKLDLDSLARAQMDDTSVVTRASSPTFKNQQLDNYANLVRSRMYVDGPDGERIQILDETEANTLISAQKSRIEAQDERYVPNKVYVDSIAAIDMAIAQGPGVRMDVMIDGIVRSAREQGVLPDTPGYKELFRNIGRYVDTVGAQRVQETAKGQLSSAYGFEVTSLDPNPADDAKVPVNLRFKFNSDKAQLRVQSKVFRLQAALATQDGAGTSSSTAISEIRSGLLGLIGPNLEGPIPVELYDAAVIARDPIMREQVFASGSTNGDRLLQFLDLVHSTGGAASGRSLIDRMRSAQIEMAFDDARTGWSTITKNAGEYRFHKDKIDGMIGEVMPDSAKWFQSLYAQSFNENMRRADGVHAEARSRTVDDLEPLIMSVGNSVLPRNDIGTKGEQHVLDMVKVLTGRDDVTFIVIGNDESGTGYLYGLRTFDGEEVTTDAQGNRIAGRLYTMQYVPAGVTSRVSLTDDAFVKKVNEFNAKRGKQSWWTSTPTYKKTKGSVSIEPKSGWQGWSEGMAQE